MKDKLLTLLVHDPRLVEVTFGTDREGNLIRIPINNKPYEEVDDVVRPESMRSENPDEFIN